MIFALLLGGQLYGLIGAFIPLPIAAMVRESVVYFRDHLVLEPWTTPTAAELAYRDRAPTDARGAPRRCSECGTPAPGTAAYCAACGAELADADEAAAAASAAPS